MIRSGGALGDLLQLSMGQHSSRAYKQTSYAHEYYPTEIRLPSTSVGSVARLSVRMYRRPVLAGSADNNGIA